MSEIQFSEVELGIIRKKIQDYFSESLGQDLGRFEAEDLVGFLSKELGSYFYNRGIYDAQAILMSKVDQITEEIYALEKPTEFER